MADHHTFFGKIFGWIGDIFHHAETVLKDVVLPLVSSILNGIKAIVENPITKEIISFIPGNLPKEIYDKLVSVLPKVSLEFNLVVDLTNATTPEQVNTALQNVFSEIKWPDDITKQKFLSSFGARIVQEIRDHEMTFAQAVIDVEYFYQNYIKVPAA